MPIEDDPPPGVPEWVVTYGDMMSLLLTFFIMLVSMSEVRESDGKFRRMLNALHEAFGPDLGKFSAPGRSLQTSSILDQLSSLGIKSRGGVEKTNRAGKGSGGAHTSVRKIRDGVIITLGGPVFFDGQSCQLSELLDAELDILATVMASKPNRIEVRGHCSAEPIPPGSPFRDHLDLSFSRAYAVAAALTDRGIDRRRIKISAAADREPRAASPAERASLEGQRSDLDINHRVDVFLIDTYTASPTDVAPAN